MNNHTATTSAPAEATAGSASNRTMVRASTTEKRDAYQIVTDAVIKAIEAGSKPWAQSWVNGKSAGTMPLRHNAQAYRGINVLILWAAQMEAGYTSPFWMTYKQAQELGAQVRKGEKGTMVCYYGTGKDDEGESEGGKVFRFLKTFTVFNTQQIDGLPERYSLAVPQVQPASERIKDIEQMIRDTGAVIHHGGNRAFYRPSTDAIQMPEFEQFRTPEFYYSTLWHELVHWTKAPARLDRSFGSESWGDEGYAREELVAELGAAFIGSELGFGPEHIEDHASYLSHWLKVLKADKRAIFGIAAKAQAAADYLLRRNATLPTEGE